MQDINGSSQCVLIVDDDEFLLLAQTRVLAALGYKNVSTAVSGKEAIRQIEMVDSNFSIVIVDIQLQDMRAEELAAELTGSHSVRTLILSSGAGPEAFTIAREAFERLNIPNIRCIKKPASMAVLREALTEVSR